VKLLDAAASAEEGRDFEHLDTTRIDHLINSGEVANQELTVVGLGSGGANVVQQLAMTGIRIWNLFDPDRLEAVNLVKHPARRVDLGRWKTDFIAEWLLDRNPTAVVNAQPIDVRAAPAFAAAADRSALVICAVDDPAVRSWINEECVRLKRPCLTGSVIRTGLGGEIYLSIPGETGCYACMQLVADDKGLSIENSIDLTDEERYQRYGLGEQNFTTSGLSIDIALVAAYHAHMAWSVLLGGRSAYVPKLGFNWLTLGIRPEPGIFASHYMIQRVLLRPQRNCYLGCGTSSSSTAVGSNVV